MADRPDHDPMGVLAAGELKLMLDKARTPQTSRWVFFWGLVVGNVLGLIVCHAICHAVRLWLRQ